MVALNVGAAHVAPAKRAFSTRRVPPLRMATLLQGRLNPAPGDLVLARVDRLGKQTKIELTDGRRAHLFPGDEIIVSFGNRYAPDQYEAVIGLDLSPCDLVAAGGIAGNEISRHQRMLPPTRITPIGLIGDTSGQRLNLMQFRVDAEDHVPDIPAILSLGTSMNAGKTLTATSMVRGLKQAGFKVAALKITGTGAGGDMWIVRDAGADVALDFTDAGFATTYLTPIPEIERATFRLLNHAASLGCEIAVIEIADGLQQLETAQLIESQAVRSIALGTVFAAYDAMGAKYGVDVLRLAGHDVLAMSGRVGRSPLGAREAEAATGLRVYSPLELQEGALLPAIRERIAAWAARPEVRKYTEGSAQPASQIARPPSARVEFLEAYTRGARTGDDGVADPDRGRIVEMPHLARSSDDHPARAFDRIIPAWRRAEIVRICAPVRQRLEQWTERRLDFRSATWKAPNRLVSIRLARRVAASFRTAVANSWTRGAAGPAPARAIRDLLGINGRLSRVTPLRLVPQPEAHSPGIPVIARPDTQAAILNGPEISLVESWDVAKAEDFGAGADDLRSWSAIARDLDHDEEGRDRPGEPSDGAGLDDDEGEERDVSTGSMFQPPHAIAGG